MYCWVERLSGCLVHVERGGAGGDHGYSQRGGASSRDGGWHGGGGSAGGRSLQDERSSGGKTYNPGPGLLGKYFHTNTHAHLYGYGPAAPISSKAAINLLPTSHHFIKSASFLTHTTQVSLIQP